jgi:hypothetical protein
MWLPDTEVRGTYRKCFKTKYEGTTFWNRNADIERELGKFLNDDFHCFVI